jgi:hypothetical protein
MEVSWLALIVGREKTIGLRVKQADEIEDLDAAFWQAPPGAGGRLGPGRARAGGSPV